MNIIFPYLVKDFIQVLAGFKYKKDAEDFVKNYPLKDQELKIIEREFKFLK